MRVKTEIWVQAYLRRCMSEGSAGYVIASGDSHAGAVYIHIDNLNGSHWLFGPAPAGMAEVLDERRWCSCFPQSPVSKDQAKAYLERQKTYDPDLWIVELEDKLGRNFLDDQLVE